jgi:hypothetical protein
MKNRMYWIILLITLISQMLNAQSINVAGKLMGKVIEKETEAELIGAFIVIKQNEVVKAETRTDFEGNFSI